MSGLPVEFALKTEREGMNINPSLTNKLTKLN